MGFYHTGEPFPAHMVRAIVGTLLEVGRGKLTVDGFRQVIEAKTVDVPGLPLPDTLSIWSTLLIPKNFFSWQSAVDCCVFPV